KEIAGNLAQTLAFAPAPARLEFPPCVPALPGDEMQAALEEVNPFALMLDPEAVFQAVERCESLNLLKRRICRPLDPEHDDEDPASDRSTGKPALRLMAG